VASPLATPGRLAAFNGGSFSGAGAWQPVGRRVAGHSAVYVTSLYAPGEPGVVAGIAWMDTALLGARLYSGSESPGYGPWPFTAPVEPPAAQSLVAAFNGGFKFPAANGGYYDYGQTIFPLRAGGASFVIYRNGSATVAMWGRDAVIGPDIAAVRQNLTLIVDNSHVVPGLNIYDSAAWGATLGGGTNVWRSGVGVMPNGALVYVAGPSLNVVQLADLLARAGCVRAMQLDINPAWPTFAWYSPVGNELASPTNGTDLLVGMEGTPGRFFESWWPRDFIALEARPVAGG
jgi:hypothetical protein